MNEIYKYFISAILGIIIGVLVVLLLQKDDTLPEVPLPPAQISAGPARPDTVYVDTLKVYVPYPFSSRKEKEKKGEEPGVDRMGDITVFEGGSDDLIVVREDLRHKSFKRFQLSPWVQSDIWAYGHCPVDSFKNDVTVRFNEYYQENIQPEWDKKLDDARANNLLKGIVAGSVAALGLATNKWYYALPALGAGVGIILYF